MSPRPHPGISEGDGSAKRVPGSLCSPSLCQGWGAAGAEGGAVLGSHPSPRLLQSCLPASPRYRRQRGCFVPQLLGGSCDVPDPAPLSRRPLAPAQ